MASWDRPRALLPVLAGIACGSAVLSKGQFGIALLPALVLVVGARWQLGLESPVRAFAPVASAISVIAGWEVLSRMASEPATLAYNDAVLAQGIRANILTAFWTRGLSLRALAITALCCGAASCGVWWCVASWRDRRIGIQSFVTLALTSIVVVHVVWFALLSIGWPRYAYFGLVTGLMLVGHAVPRWLEAVAGQRWRRWAHVGAAAALVAMMVMTSLWPLYQGAGSAAAAEMSAFIDRHVQRDAVIETWEWELSGIGQHLQFHFPSNQLAFTADAQHGRGLPFALNYDLLAGDPAYLVTGPFSGFTAIYRPDAIDAHFDRVITFAPYVLYVRRR